MKHRPTQEDHGAALPPDAVSARRAPHERAEHVGPALRATAADEAGEASGRQAIETMADEVATQPQPVASATIAFAALPDAGSGVAGRADTQVMANASATSDIIGNGAYAATAEAPADVPRGDSAAGLPEGERADPNRVPGPDAPVGSGADSPHMLTAASAVMAAPAVATPGPKPTRAGTAEAAATGASASIVGIAAETGITGQAAAPAAGHHAADVASEALGASDVQTGIEPRRPDPLQLRANEARSAEARSEARPALETPPARADLAGSLLASNGARELDNGPAGEPRATLPEPAGRPLPPSAVPVEIGLRALQGLKEFQIRLDPAELGRVEIRLSIDEDSTVKARVVVDRVDTLNLLQRDAKTLERAFEQAGLKSADGGIDMTLRDPGQHNRGHGREAWEGGGAFSRKTAASAIDPEPMIRRVLHRGALDLTI